MNSLTSLLPSNLVRFVSVCFRLLNKFVDFGSRFCYHFALLLFLLLRIGEALGYTHSITFTFHYTFRTLALPSNEFHPIHVQLYTAVKSNYADFDETESTSDWKLFSENFRRLYNIISVLLLSRLFFFYLFT